MAFNGHKRTATISAAATVIVATITVGSFMLGWRTKIRQADVREDRIDRMLSASDGVVKRVDELEKGRALNAANIERLVEAQRQLTGQVSQLVESQNNLSNTLMRYLAQQHRGQ